LAKRLKDLYFEIECHKDEKRGLLLQLAANIALGGTTINAITKITRQHFLPANVTVACKFDDDPRICPLSSQQELVHVVPHDYAM
jgi:hypothetical protein